MGELNRWMDFIREAEGLKSVMRTAWTSTGRRESTAEHSWRLALLAGVALSKYPHLDSRKTLMMCLIHDIGERYGGDVSAAQKPDQNEKYEIESRDAKRIFSLLPPVLAEELYELWEEYNENKTPESRLVKALDKAETIIQHNQGRNPESFDYEFNLTYGTEYFTDGLLVELREILDGDTKLKIGK